MYVQECFMSENKLQIRAKILSAIVNLQNNHSDMSFVGNTKHTVPYMLKNSHLFESIPTSFIKGAFLDRMHLYNPGWEIKMLKKNSFSKGYGLITDYIAAVLHEKFSRFSLSRCSQKNRRCKAFNVSITKTEE